jgi:hypothetical protein
VQDQENFLRTGFIEEKEVLTDNEGKGLFKRPNSSPYEELVIPVPK